MVFYCNVLISIFLISVFFELFFVKICRNVIGKFKDKKVFKLEIFEDVEDVIG